MIRHRAEPGDRDAAGGADLAVDPRAAGRAGRGHERTRGQRGDRRLPGDPVRRSEEREDDPAPEPSRRRSTRWARRRLLTLYASADICATTPGYPNGSTFEGAPIARVSGRWHRGGGNAVPIRARDQWISGAAEPGGPPGRVASARGGVHESRQQGQSRLRAAPLRGPDRALRSASAARAPQRRRPPRRKSSAELTSALPIPPNPDGSVQWRVVFSQALPKLKRGEVLEAIGEVELVNPTSLSRRRWAVPPRRSTRPDRERARQLGDRPQRRDLGQHPARDGPGGTLAGRLPGRRRASIRRRST